MSHNRPPKRHGLRQQVESLQEETLRALPAGEPVIIHLEGRAFRTFVGGRKDPFDPEFHAVMARVATVCLQESGALLAHVAGSQILLCLRGDDNLGTRSYFCGNLQGITANLAARATAVFNQLVPPTLLTPSNRAVDPLLDLPVFGCRVWSVPSEENACDVFRWRETEVTAHATERLARRKLSTRNIMGKSTPEIRSLLAQNGVDLSHYPEEFRVGQYFRREVNRSPYTLEELAQLPPRHHARLNLGAMVERHETRALPSLTLRDLVNAPDVLFRGAEPVKWAGPKA